MPIQILLRGFVYLIGIDMQLLHMLGKISRSGGSAQWPMLINQQSRTSHQGHQEMQRYSVLEIRTHPLYSASDAAASKHKDRIVNIPSLVMSAAVT